MGMAGKVGPAASAETALASGEKIIGAGETHVDAADGFDPFFERIAAAAPEAIIPKVTLPFLLASAYYLLHSLAFGENTLNLFPLMLAAIIFTVPLMVFLATSIFRDIFGQLDNRAGSGAPPAYPAELSRLLSGRNFMIVAAAFAVTSLATSLGMGLDLEVVGGLMAIATVSVGYLIAGALCGVAVWGVFGIVQTLRAYVRHDQPRFDFTAPDGCGGMLFFGRAVTTFSIIALVGGVLVTSYIFLANGAVHNAHGHDASGPEIVVLWFWLAAPYVLAVMVLLVPTFEIHNALHAYKVGEDQKIETEMAELDAAFEAKASDAETLKSLRIRHTRASERRVMLYGMSTWPFSLNTHLKFALLMGLNGVATLFSASGGELGKTAAGIIGFPGP